MVKSLKGFLKFTKEHAKLALKRRGISLYDKLTYYYITHFWMNKNSNNFSSKYVLMC